VKKEPFFAINVVLYCKSLISMCRVTNSSKNKEKPQQQQEKQIQTFREGSTATKPVGGELQG